MKIVQLFGREEIEQTTFDTINERQKRLVKDGMVQFYLLSSGRNIDLSNHWALVWYGGFRTLYGGDISLGTLFLFIQLSQMLFRPYDK